MTLRLLVAAVATVLLTGCHVKNQLYNPVPNSVVAVRATADRTDQVDPACNPVLSHPCMAFLEFDERGEYWDTSRRQLTAALELIDRAKVSNQPPPFVVTFVHGWKNNARNDTGRQNGNVVGFEGVLQFLAARYPRNPVVGIYIGWRGDLVPKMWPVRRQLTYFNREGAAIRVPGPSMTAALTAIVTRARRGRRDAQVVFVGHSFGALVLERAMSQAMSDFILRHDGCGLGPDPGDGGDAVPNLVLFVNSAAAATEGKQMLDLLKANCRGEGRRISWQQTEDGREWPLFLSVSSIADTATRSLMPIGHGPSFIGEKLRGGFRRYEPADPPELKSQAAVYMSTTAHMEVHQSHVVREIPDLVPRCAQIGASPVPGLGPMRLANGLSYEVCQRPGRWNDTPYWVMQIPGSIVRDHGSIFNRNFVAFIDNFVPDIPTDVAPDTPLMQLRDVP